LPVAELIADPSIETLPALLTRRAEQYAAKQAIVGDDESLSYAELARRSLERAAWLLARGVNKGHRVGLMMPNGVEWAVNACAVMRTGAVLVPLSTLLRPPELQAQLRVAGVRHLLARASFRGRDYRDEWHSVERDSLPSLRDVWWQEETGAATGEGERALAAALEDRVRPADDMVVIFTSGSSGSPKGVIHTHGGALRANAAGLAARCIDADTRLYLPMPLFWAGGFAGGLISALNAGATLLTEAVPEPGRTLEFLARERATLFRGWPEQAAELAAHPHFDSVDLSALGPGSLQALLPAKRGGAAPGSRANLFGMTESFGPYSGYSLDRDLPPGKRGSCGRPFAGMAVRVVDPDTGAILAAGETGHIQIGGRNILRGICEREREDIFTADGWYDTGDLGRLDGDGFLYFSGRSDEMIKIRGATVYPSEVACALEELPGVRRAFAVEIEVDGKAALGAAVIAATPGALSESELIEQAQGILSVHKLPSCWRVLDSPGDVPRTPTGKLDKAALRSLVLSASPDTGPARSPPE
jgi:acyl-CoA synthetase (AMP-forming)/AMP-acid ligase II